MTTVGENLRRAREKKEWSQAQLAVYSGEGGVSTVSQIENNRRNASVRTLIRYARALGIKPSSLLEGVE